VTAIKLVVVGDGTVGKTSLLIRAARGEFLPTDGVPVVFDNYSTRMLGDSGNEDVMLWDTAGQEDYDRLRPLSYPGTDVFLVCYDVTNANSFDNVSAKWWPELTHHCPGTPLILVGCKSDKPSRPGTARMTSDQALGLRRSIGAAAFMECSALADVGVKEVFLAALRAAHSAAASPKKKQGCFLTTACALARDLPDDCEELTTLRGFRDGALMRRPEGPALVEQYDVVAPRIVLAMLRDPSRSSVMDETYGVIRACVAAIHGGHDGEAVRLYRDLVLSLAVRYDVPLARL